MIDVATMHNHIDGEGHARTADKGRHLQFLCVCACAGDPVGDLFTRILKTELDVVQSSGDKFLPTLLGQADA
jgi:hypothetical protein